MHQDRRKLPVGTRRLPSASLIHTFILGCLMKYCGRICLNELPAILMEFTEKIGKS